MQVVFASLCREPCARLHEEAGLAGGAHRFGDRDANQQLIVGLLGRKGRLSSRRLLAWTLSILRMLKLGQARSKPNPKLAKSGQARAKTIQESGSVFLGFPCPN
jgi:hypothetical protein